MTANTKPIKCGACDVPLKIPADAKGEDIVSCPSCGEGDTLDNVIAELGNYLSAASAEYLGKSLERSTRGNKHVKFTRKPVPRRSYRFTVDLDLHA